MTAIYKREMLAYFTSPLAYIFAAVFIAASSLAFALSTTLLSVGGEEIQLGTYFLFLMVIFAIMLPILTMRLFSEDKKTKTEQLILTSPVSLFEMVMGKFFAAYTIFAMCMAINAFQFIALYSYGTPNTPQLLGYLIAILLLGGAFIASGIFFSSVTENQLVAALLAIGLQIIFVALPFVSSYVDSAFLRILLGFFGLYTRFSNFTYGIFDISALVYYLSIIFAFLFLTVRVYNRRRWM